MGSGAASRSASLSWGEWASRDVRCIEIEPSTGSRGLSWQGAGVSDADACPATVADPAHWLARRLATGRCARALAARIIPMEYEYRLGHGVGAVVKGARKVKR